MSISLDSHEATLTCPQCCHQIKETIGRLKHDQYVTCPTCGRFEKKKKKIIAIERDANEALAELKDFKITLKL